MPSNQQGVSIGLDTCIQMWRQVGRAGRSGDEGFCHLFLCDTDFRRLRSLAFAEAIDTCQVEAFLEDIFCSDHCSFSKRRSKGAEPSGAYGILEIPQLVSRLDAKEEVLETILAYLEVHHLSLVICIRH